MELTISQRKAVTKVTAARYRRVSKGEKGQIFDELCATTGWHRNHARKALSGALKPRVVRPRRPRPPVYGEEVVAALRLCWAVLGAPAGKRMAPFLPVLVARPAASWTSTRKPRRRWAGCRRPRSTGGWRETGRS